MKREEKNKISRGRILDSALREFAEKGYGMSSVNTICAAGDISKGVLYHYFQDKDALYVTCVRACFDALTDALRSESGIRTGGVQERLSRYFRTRAAFFSENPACRRIFCDAVVAPPAHLAAEIADCRAAFDAFNIETLGEILDCASLRRDVSREEIIDTFRLYQDFVNANSRGSEEDVALREHSCLRAVSILLYGVLERKEAMEA